EVGIPRMRRPAATRLPRASIANAAVDPVPSPTTIPSRACSAADSAAIVLSRNSSMFIALHPRTHCSVWPAACLMSRMEMHSEIDLIPLARQGDRLAIAELFRRHYPSSLSVARRILGSGEDSYDAVQTAYCSAFEHFSSFRGEAGFRTWITRIVMNCCF